MVLPLGTRINILIQEFPQTNAFVSVGWILMSRIAELKGLGIFILTNIASLFSKMFVNFYIPPAMHKRGPILTAYQQHQQFGGGGGELFSFSFFSVLLLLFCLFLFYGQLSDN